MGNKSYFEEADHEEKKNKKHEQVFKKILFDEYAAKQWSLTRNIVYDFSQPPLDPNCSINKATMEKHCYVAFLLLFSSLSTCWWLLLEMRQGWVNLLTELA